MKLFANICEAKTVYSNVTIPVYMLSQPFGHQMGKIGYIGISDLTWEWIAIIERGGFTNVGHFSSVKAALAAMEKHLRMG